MTMCRQKYAEVSIGEMMDVNIRLHTQHRITTNLRASQDHLQLIDRRRDRRGSHTIWRGY